MVRTWANKPLKAEILSSRDLMVMRAPGTEQARNPKTSSLPLCSQMGMSSSHILLHITDLTEWRRISLLLMVSWHSVSAVPSLLLARSVYRPTSSMLQSSMDSFAVLLSYVRCRCLLSRRLRPCLSQTSSPSGSPRSTSHIRVTAVDDRTVWSFSFFKISGAVPTKDKHKPLTTYILQKRYQC